MLRRSLLALVLYSSLATGCDDGGDASETLTKSQVIAAADKLCGDTARRLDGLTPLPRSLREAEASLNEQAAISREQVQKVRTLAVPASGRAMFQVWASANSEIAEVTTAMAAAAGAGDQANFQRLAARRDKLAARSEQAAFEYGFRVCGRNG